jgi:hypothetical protein
MDRSWLITNVERIYSFKGIWVLLAGSSSCCSKGTLACCRKCQEEHTDTWSNTLGRRTCMASCEMSPSNDRYTLVCNLYAYIYIYICHIHHITKFLNMKMEPAHINHALVHNYEQKNIVHTNYVPEGRSFPLLEACSKN